MSVGCLDTGQLFVVLVNCQAANEGTGTQNCVLRSFMIYTGESHREGRNWLNMFSRMWEKRNAFKVYDWKFERDLPLGRTRPTGKDEIEVGVREV